MKFTTRLSLLIATAVLATVSPARAAEPFQAGQFSFTAPKGWKKLESTSSMRAAELKAGEAKDAPEVVFFFFGAGGAGGVKANVDRWLSQFQDAKNTKTEEKTVGKTKVTYVQAEGTYLSGMPGAPKTPQPNSALLGAIIEGSEGSVFVRMTGPAAQVKSVEGDFKSMIEAPLK